MLEIECFCNFLPTGIPIVLSDLTCIVCELQTIAPYWWSVFPSHGWSMGVPPYMGGQVTHYMGGLCGCAPPSISGRGPLYGWSVCVPPYMGGRNVHYKGGQLLCSLRWVVRVSIKWEVRSC